MENHQGIHHNMKDIKYQSVTLVSLDQIKQEILNENVKNVCEHMCAAGMYGDDMNAIYSLVELCVNSKDEWIRNAGFLCLYHLNVRLKQEINEDFLFQALSLGIADTSKVVNGTIDSIFDDLETFNQELWLKFQKH